MGESVALGLTLCFSSRCNPPAFQSMDEQMNEKLKAVTVFMSINYCREI